MKSDKNNNRLSRFGAIALGLLLVSSSAHAIPSPDLVINLSASIAQLVGLLSVVFGGVALSGKNKPKSAAMTRGRKQSKAVIFFGLALLLVSVGFNVFQYTSSVDEKNQRLHTNLVRKSVENGQKVGDVNLKTLSFSDQQSHELGLTTEEVDALLNSGTQLNIIDVREDAEVEGGMIAGARHLRYPDVMASPDLLADQGSGTQNLLLCFSGNRSSELCEEMAAQGKSCNFMVGGYEKWLTESRPLNGRAEGDDTLRKIRDYKNKDVLLDTPDVKQMVAEDQAQFIDVRYPAEFEAGHLPGAINITMRALRTNELDARLNSLSDVPYIAACYDKRSCFYSTLIGLELDKRGYDFRGRYTVPHEYYVAGGARQHVAAYEQAKAQQTLLSFVTTPLASVLNSVSDSVGHYVLAILLLVLSVRLSLMPLTVKAERDQLVLKALKPEITELKARYAEHPRALARKIVGIYKKNRIKPVINIAMSFLQIGLLVLFFDVVTQASRNWTDAFLWIPVAAEIDPLYITPVLVSALFALLISQSLDMSRKRSRLIVAGVAVGMLALTALLSAAANIYLGISMLFLLVQSLVIGHLAERYNWRGDSERTEEVEDDGLVPLRQAHWVEGTGKKAARLGELMQLGYRVPDGFVATDKLAIKLANSNDPEGALSKAEQKKLKKLWRAMKGSKVAVRSSGLNEDAADASYAGVYDSILNVERTGLLAAIRRVHGSLIDGTAENYQHHLNPSVVAKGSKLHGGAVVQKMVKAEYAGVLFSEHPANAGAVLVEVVEGLGEGLVSGTVTPTSYSFGRFSLEALDGQECPIDLTPLLRDAQQLEAHFGCPQDIEWAYAKGKFYLLQARDITASICKRDSLTGFSESERLRLLEQVADASADEVVYSQNELAELLPRPTPLSASFMQQLWAAGGSADLACQVLGMPYEVDFESPDFVTTVFGHTYINKHEENRRIGKGASAVAAFRLARNAEEIERAFHEDFLPAFQQRMAMRKAMDYTRLNTEELLATLTDKLRRFVSETYVQAEIINIAADYYYKTADSKLRQKGEDPAKYLNYVPETVVSRAMGLISQSQPGKAELLEFLNMFGHRAPFDYELSAKRYSEDPSLLMGLINGPSVSHKPSGPAPLPEQKLLRISVDRVHRFQALKEEAKHYALLELNQIRQVLLALDAAFALEGNIFQLTLEEITVDNVLATPAQAHRLIATRLHRQHTWKKLLPPAKLTVKDLELMDVMSGRVSKADEDGELVGKRVAGEGRVRGVARVILDIDEIGSFEEGEILVARMTDPQWYPLFPKAAGIVTEVGGWLSHAAIVAREYNLPAIVGVADACSFIRTGDVVEMGADGQIQISGDRRAPDSPMRRKAATRAAVPAGDRPTAGVYSIAAAKAERRDKLRAAKRLRERQLRAG